MDQRNVGADRRGAVREPASAFREPREPMDLVTDRTLSHDAKLRLLIRWERDAQALAVAENEGMSGGEESKLGRVRRALRAIAGHGPERARKRH